MTTPLDPHIFGPDQMCFGCGPNNAVGMRLHFPTDGDEVVTTFHAKEGWDGPPGILHGGLQATLADEIGAWTLVGQRHRFGFTTSANLRWIRPARTALPIEARGRIIDESDTHATVKVSLRQEGRIVLTGQLRFLYATIEQAEKMLGQELPPAWRALARPPDAE